MAKLLLVEDDNNLREIYEARLQAEGYTIVSAKDGEDALAVAKAEKPDLVISDIMMPKISGFEMLDILRNTNDLKNIKVIMLTALGQSDDQQRADKLGADKYLVKSQVTLEDIVKTTHELLGDTPKAASTETNTSAPATSTTPDPAAPAIPVQEAPVSSTPAPSPAPAPAPVPEPETPTVPPPVPTAEPETPAPAPDSSTVPTELAPMPEPITSSSESVKTDETTVDNDNPQTENQEESAVENQIEQFVDSPSADSVEPEATAEDNQTSDDQVMSEAVTNLNTSDAVTSDPDPDAPTIIKPNAVASLDEPKVDANTEIDSPTLGDSTDSDDGVSIAHKKVISPLDNKDKPDINDLLAKEEAKNIITSESVTAHQILPMQPNAQPTTSGEDPNSIAL